MSVSRFVTKRNIVKQPGENRQAFRQRVIQSDSYVAAQELQEKRSFKIFAVTVIGVLEVIGLQGEIPQHSDFVLPAVDDPDVIELTKDGLVSIQLSQERIGLSRWLDSHDAIYYAAPRDTFSEYTARERAVNAGKSMVVVEDLS